MRIVRVAVWVLAAVLLGVAGAVALYETSVQPGAALVAAVFNSGQLVKPPPGFAAAAATVTERRVAVPVPGAPAAHLDIYEARGVRGAAQAAGGATGGGGLRPVVLWVHGGGFISSSAATVQDYAILLAHAGYTVASLDYSLAPGTKYPAPIRQGNAALRFLRAQAGRFGGDPDRIVLGGDSAGAQIAGQLAAVQTNPGLARAMGITPADPPPAGTAGAGAAGAASGGAASGGIGLRGVVLFCGLYDMRTVGGTGFPGLRTYLWSYTGVRDWTSYPAIGQLSVTAQVTADYPATFLSVGDADPFRTQGTELAGVLRAHKVPVTTLLWHGQHLNHEYQFNFTLPQARTAFQRMLAFLAQVTR
jgi:acetyl esterase/lipase